MKFLVVAGSPSVDVPGLGIKVRADSSQFAIDGYQVAQALHGAPDKEHEVTVLTDDAASIKDGEGDRFKIIEAKNMDDLRALLLYLPLEVEYDAIAVCLHLPRFNLEGMYSSHDRIDGIGASDLFDVRLDETHFPEDPFLRFSELEDDKTQIASDVYKLRGKGCKAGIVLLEAVSARPGPQSPQELLQDRCEDIQDGEVEMVVLDINGTHKHRKGAYCIGRNGGSFVEGARLEAFIVEALELGKHEKPKTKEELKKLRAAAKGKATKARNKAAKLAAETEAAEGNVENANA